MRNNVRKKYKCRLVVLISEQERDDLLRVARKKYGRNVSEAVRDALAMNKKQVFFSFEERLLDLLTPVFHDAIDVNDTVWYSEGQTLLEKIVEVVSEEFN